MQKLKVLFILSLATLLFYSTILINPKLILERGNDLQEYYLPITYYTKEHLLKDHTLPFWNNMFFSGTPLLPDPQSLLFYPPNLIFLIFPINSAFIIWFFIHTTLGGIGAYLVARKGLGLSQVASLFTAIFYIVFPKTAGYLEAGHITLIATTMWLPFLLLATLKLIKAPEIKWSVLLGISLTSLFFTFPTMFATAGAVVSLFVFSSYLSRRGYSLNTLIKLGIGFAITVGLCAITLLPQLEWIPQTTRYILLQDRDVYPKWLGGREFISALYPHIIGGKNFIFDLDSEKWIASGLLISFLATVGFFKIDLKLKIFISLIAFTIIIICLNNISPIQSLLLSSDWFVLSRVPTRNWFIIIFIIIYLAGFGLDILLKSKLRRPALIVAVLAVGELLILSWIRLERPIPPQRERVSSALYEFLAKDTEVFRVFCTTRCLSQSDVSKYKLETIEGYATIYQKNYYDYFIQLSQVFWDKYSSTLPPISVYNFREIQPIAAILADDNVKYVISPFNLKDKDYKEVGQFGKLKLYENKLFRTRAYFYARGSKSEIEAPLIYYSPNKIIIDTSKHKASEIILAQTWNSGWKAKSDDGKRIKVIETANKLMQIKIGLETKSVELYYFPESYRLGRAISVFTLIILALYFILFFKKKKRF